MQLFLFALIKLKHLAGDRCSSKFIQRHSVFLQNLSKTSRDKYYYCAKENAMKYLTEKKIITVVDATETFVVVNIKPGSFQACTQFIFGSAVSAS